MNCAPIVLFVYARPEHTFRTVESLLCNRLAGASNLIVYSDAARTSAQLSDVEAVRSYLPSIKGFRSVTIRYRAENLGLANSIIQGVTEALQCHDRVIVLEDDMVTSPHFLDYMNDALDMYANDARVASVHGYVYPVADELPETFFLKGADCWGWATWRRGWKLFNPDGRYLLDELRRRNLTREFDFNGTYGYSEMLERQIRGENDSWAVRWYASAFLADKLTLYPGRSLVHNIGTDSSGTHCRNTTLHDVRLSRTRIELRNISVEESMAGRLAFERFFRSSRPGLVNRAKGRIRSFLLQSRC